VGYEMFSELALTIFGQFVGLILAIFILNLKFKNSREIEFQKSSYEMGRLFFQQQESRREKILKIHGEFSVLMGRVLRFGDKTFFFINHYSSDTPEDYRSLAKEFDRYYIKKICSDLDTLYGLACSYFVSAKSAVEELSAHCNIVWGVEHCFFDTYPRLLENERSRRLVELETHFTKTRTICARIQSLVEKDLSILQEEPR